MGIMSYRRDFPFLKKCDICHKPRHSLYELDMSGYKVMACSAHCAEEGRRNWQEKEDLGIKPGMNSAVIKSRVEEHEESDNISEF